MVRAEESAAAVTTAIKADCGGMCGGSDGRRWRRAEELAVEMMVGAACGGIGGSATREVATETEKEAEKVEYKWNKLSCCPDDCGDASALCCIKGV